MKRKFKYKKDEEGIRRRVYRLHGFEGYWTWIVRSCSGCYDWGGDYPWDEKNGCYIGSGCSWCGYTGKTRIKWFVPFNHKGFEAWIDKKYKEEGI